MRGQTEAAVKDVIVDWIKGVAIFALFFWCLCSGLVMPLMIYVISDMEAQLQAQPAAPPEPATSEEPISWTGDEHDTPIPEFMQYTKRARERGVVR